MAAFQPSKVFAELIKSSNSSPPKAKRAHLDGQAGLASGISKEREIQVWATGEMSLKPDRCRLCIKVTSTKDSIDEAKTSVSRRVDYVFQTLHNHGVKESDLQEYKTTQRVESAYKVNVELHVQFSDFQKCQSVSNLLVEKLDETVHVGLPEFYHTAQSLENLRRQASVLAIHNAKQKAQEIACLVHQAVGRPTVIQEEEVKEWEGGSDDIDNLNSTSIQQRISSKTVSVSCKVFVSFDLKPKVKTKYVNE
ncbi:interleukin-1 receptor-associated kinase 1-binding protein 1-like [Liolophura sinensis]|uniref:interleukin-1 receptor-associated kinase 1-binding protein 1-like n=1 Tax=Liolophura sinensis TaxID=3198878 RepID=UPI00315972CF